MKNLVAAGSWRRSQSQSSLPESRGPERPASRRKAPAEAQTPPSFLPFIPSRLCHWDEAARCARDLFKYTLFLCPLSVHPTGNLSPSQSLEAVQEAKSGGDQQITAHEKPLRRSDQANCRSKEREIGNRRGLTPFTSRRRPGRGTRGRTAALRGQTAPASSVSGQVSQFQSG